MKQPGYLELFIAALLRIEKEKNYRLYCHRQDFLPFSFISFIHTTHTHSLSLSFSPSSSLFLSLSLSPSNEAQSHNKANN